MEYVVDTVILFSFFKPESYTRELFKSLYLARARFFAPDYMLEELYELKTRICEYSRISQEEFEASYALLSELISVIPKSEYESYIPAASSLLPGHSKDIPYFALALKLMAPVWSNEKRFKKQSQIVVYSTTELKHLFDV